MSGPRGRIARRPRLVVERWDDGHLSISGGMATVLVHCANTNAAGRAALLALAKRHGIYMQCVDETHGTWQAYIPLNPPEGCESVGDGQTRFLTFLRAGADTLVSERCLPDPPADATPEERRNWARIRRAPRKAVPLVRGWEYVLDVQPPRQAMGSGGGEGWREKRPTIRPQEMDGGRSLDQHRASTGLAHVPGRKRTTGREEGARDDADAREAADRAGAALICEAIRAALGADASPEQIALLSRGYMAFLSEHGRAPDLDELLAYAAEREATARERADESNRAYRMGRMRERAADRVRWARRALKRIERVLAGKDARED